MASKIKKGDKVVVLAGKDKGKTGQVLSVIPSETKALVQGINLVKRHQKQTASTDAGIFTKEAPIHLSNLAVADANGKPSRVGFSIVDGFANAHVQHDLVEARKLHDILVAELLGQSLADVLVIFGPETRNVSGLSHRSDLRWSWRRGSSRRP